MTRFRCAGCGKFVNPSDGNVVHFFLPDTEISFEVSEFWHKDCSPPSERGYHNDAAFSLFAGGITR